MITKFYFAKMRSVVEPDFGHVTRVTFSAVLFNTSVQNFALEIDSHEQRVSNLSNQVQALSKKPETTQEQTQQLQETRLLKLF